jgi:hypothetical protein
MQQGEKSVDDLTVGWRAIGLATGRKPDVLRVQNSDGRLPVQPLRVGHRVAMTPEQIELLKVKPA